MFGLYKIQYCLPNNIALLVNIDKFESNPILVNLNKAKSYQYLDETSQRPEATIEGGGKHKGDLEEDHKKSFTKNEFPSKSDFGNNKPRNTTFTKLEQMFLSKVLGDSGTNLQLTNFGLEANNVDSSLESMKNNFNNLLKKIPLQNHIAKILSWNTWV